MGCIENPKRWGPFKWHGPHKLKITRIVRFGRVADCAYTATVMCERCRVNLFAYECTENSLVKQGFDVDKLQSLCWIEIGDNADKLKKENHEH